MNIKTLTFATLFLTTSNHFIQAAYADNFMMVIGGGGEPSGETTIFDSAMKTLGDNLKNSKWKYQVAFNGGHKKTEELMKSSYPNSMAPINSFTTENYKKMIDAYKAKIILGDIKSGDQLVVMLNTHGAAKNENDKIQTHLVAVSGGSDPTNLNNLTGAKLVSVDDLQELVKLTNEKGIKLGIIDLSCHSGNTQALKKDAPNTCVITATGPKHYGYAGDTAFPNKFMKNLKKGNTLEGAFLKARAESSDPSYPMISTDESNQIVAEVYASITPYLYYYDPHADKMTDYFLNNSKDCITCLREQQFTNLIKRIKTLQTASTGSSSGFNGEELKRLLNEYKATQDNIIQQQKALGMGMIDNKENFSAPAMIKGKIISTFNRKDVDWNEIITCDPDKIIATITGYTKSETPPRTKAEQFAAIEVWKQIKVKQLEILAKYPNLKTVKEESKKIAKKIGENYETAEKIALQERKFYDELYRQKQSLNTSDPCRQIVF